ncbi:MAG: HAD-superfamily hydrolase, subfamily variant 3 [Acidimicrobiales bacterium]|nr:HAD-superfamily hydrolase, subfamily variant 3 [Acidimicrobiales bacterium]
MTRPGILLDIDGTLLDTNHLHALAWWRGLRTLGFTRPLQQIHDLVGMGGDKLVPELLGHDVEGASEAWEREFDALLPEVTLLPGARELVERLHGEGFVVVLASSSPAELLDRFRELLDIDRWLAGATSSGDADRSKPDSDIFDVALDRHGLTRATTVAIGDTVWDAKAARRARIGFVGVQTGGTHPDELRRHGAYRAYADLVELVEDLPVGPLAPLCAANRT